MNMTDLVRRVTAGRHQTRNYPEFTTGDTVNVHVRVREGEKERIQIFRGVVIKIQGSGIGRSFTVRKISSGVGVERSFPLYSPSVEKIELYSRGKVRRGRLFYLRDLRGRAARLESELVTGSEKDVGDAIPQETPSKEATKK